MSFQLRLYPSSFLTGLLEPSSDFVLPGIWGKPEYKAEAGIFSLGKGKGETTTIAFLFLLPGS